jgi:hypothetical protein
MGYFQSSGGKWYFSIKLRKKPDNQNAIKRPIKAYIARRGFASSVFYGIN